MRGPSLEGLINSDLLGWAREASSLEVATVARKLKQSEARVRAWETGEQTPSLAQLRKLAQLYKRSVGVFFLNERPGAFPQPADFRRLELSNAHFISGDLALDIREAQAKRDAALDIFAQLEDEPPIFNLGLQGNAPAEELAEKLINRVGVAMGHRRTWGTDYDALNAWKAAVEALGVLVMQVSGVPVSEMRGCSLALFPLPVILLNSADRPLGRVFTLLHELVHLVRAESGLCDVCEDVERAEDKQRIEAYCNHVAGAVLVPLGELRRQPAVARANARSEWNSDALEALRRTFWASREAILRRLLIAEKTSLEFYRRMRAEFQRQHAGDEGETSGGFATFPRRVVLANGRLLTGLVVDAYESSVITGTDLARILGTKLDHLPKIVDVLRERKAA